MLRVGQANPAVNRAAGRGVADGLPVGVVEAFLRSVRGFADGMCVPSCLVSLTGGRVGAFIPQNRLWPTPRQRGSVSAPRGRDPVHPPPFLPLPDRKLFTARWWGRVGGAADGKALHCCWHRTTWRCRSIAPASPRLTRLHSSPGGANSATARQRRGCGNSRGIFSGFGAPDASASSPPAALPLVSASSARVGLAALTCRST